MSQSSSDEQHPYPLLDVILTLLRGDFASLAIKYILPHLPRLLRQLRAMYEVLEYETKLELLDPQGKLAVYTKHQKVRFLQDNVIAYQDQAWGDGDIFADYKCSPGVPVDRYQEGYRYRILISLRQTKNRGDIEEFRIERYIKDGFMKADGSFQTNVDHRTQKLTLRVIFPSGRAPLQVLFVQQHAARTTTLGAENIRRLSD